MTVLAASAMAQPPPPPPVVIAPPAVVVQPPPAAVVPVPGVTVTVGVPDNYVWDGTEYVGWIGDQYYYLGPGNVWLEMGGDRLAHFRTWERDHADWHTHVIRNELYRRDAHGHDHPWQDHATDHHDAPNHGGAADHHDDSDHRDGDRH